MYRLKIYLLGSLIYEKDSLPIRLLPKLKSSLPQFQFQHLDPTETLPEEENLILIDTIINATKISVLTDNDIEKIKSFSQCSLHDFDLGFQLKLMKKLNKIKKVTIIGVPPEINEKKALEELSAILNSITFA